MLFVDNDEPEVADRREDGASRTDNDASRARAYAMPLVVALAVGKRRVENRDLVAKARREPADSLGREGNLGNHHDRAATRLELLRNCLEIHLGLARPSDAKEKDWLRRGRYDTERRRLLVIQRERLRRKDAPHVAKRIAALLPRSDGDEAEPPQLLEGRRRRL